MNLSRVEVCKGIQRIDGGTPNPPSSGLQQRPTLSRMLCSRNAAKAVVDDPGKHCPGNMVGDRFLL
jgi:hypothetical protein